MFRKRRNSSNFMANFYFVKSYEIDKYCEWSVKRVSLDLVTRPYNVFDRFKSKLDKI